MRWTRRRRSSVALILPALLSAGALAAQVAPTLPRDTLYNRLPPESSVPRRVIAPTLPRDTIRAGAASAPDAPRVDSIDRRSIPRSRPPDAITPPAPPDTVRAAPVPTSPSPRRPRRQPLPQRRT